MLGFSVTEILLIAVVGIIVIGPKDLPVVIRHVAKFIREAKELVAGVKGHMDALVKEAGVDDMHRELTTIIDLDGKPQQAFDVKELHGLKAETSAPFPLAGEGRDEGAATKSAQSSSPLTQPSPARGEG